MPRAILLACLIAAAQSPGAGAPAQDGRQEPVSPEETRLVETLAGHGIRIDLAGGSCSIQVEVVVREDLLEYLLVGPAGAAHEALFVTGVRPSVLNTALLALGVEPGANARWTPKDPPIDDEDLRQGISPYDVKLPVGDGFHLYAGWKQGGESYFYRVEDLLRNLASGQSMRRHRWVYLGSRMVPKGRPESGEEVFGADMYQNLINIAFFSEGLTLATAALPECMDQTIWMANPWLLPERGSAVELFFSRERIERLPAEIAERLPEVAPAPARHQDGERR
jgi:hypothetical protein